MAIDKPRDRPSVASVLPIVRRIYEGHCAGCCLHILTDDGNCEQSSADFCLQWARERGHEDCIAAAEMLVQMTDTQRRKVYVTW
jgi:hypothetical protein